MDEGDRRFRHSRTVLWRYVGREVLVGLPSGEGVEVLAGTAGHVWRLLADQPTLAQLSGLLGEAYGAPREVVAADVGALLEELCSRGFVEEVVADVG